MVKVRELCGFIENRTLNVVDKRVLPIDTDIFVSRFVDSIENGNTIVQYKSQFGADTYEDEHSASIATKAPSAQRLTQRLLLCIASSFEKRVSVLRNIASTYIQSKTSLETEVFIRTTLGMGYLSSGFKGHRIFVRNTRFQTTLVP